MPTCVHVISCVCILCAYNNIISNNYFDYYTINIDICNNTKYKYLSIRIEGCTLPLPLCIYVCMYMYIKRSMLERGLEHAPPPPHQMSFGSGNNHRCCHFIGKQYCIVSHIQIIVGCTTSSSSFTCVCMYNLLLCSL